MPRLRAVNRNFFSPRVSGLYVIPGNLSERWCACELHGAYELGAKKIEKLFYFHQSSLPLTFSSSIATRSIATVTRSSCSRARWTSDSATASATPGSISGA